MRIEEIPMSLPRRGDQHVVSFDERELALILFEAMMEVPRPPGMALADCLDAIEEHDQQLIEELQRMSQAALKYVIGQLKAGRLERAQ